MVWLKYILPFCFFAFTTDLISANRDTTIRFIVIHDIHLIGNRITHPSIILREIMFTADDTVGVDDISELIGKSKENLLKTSLFNYVYIDLIEKNGVADIDITVEERWYIWPSLFFNHADRNLSSWWKSKDFNRVNYGLGLTQYNFRGRKEKLNISFLAGYDNQLSFGYYNLFLDKKRRNSIDIDFFFKSQTRMDYNIVANEPVRIESASNLFTNNRYYIKYSYRKKVYKSFMVVGSYNYFSISDTVVALNNEFLGDSKKKTDYFGLNFYYENDQRDLKYYPLTGFYLLTRFSYYGFKSGIAKPEFNISYFRFFRLSDSFFASAGINSQITVKKKQPYILKNGLGYDYYLRGFENYVITGYNYWLLKTGLKYKILPVKIINLGFIPFRQFNKIHFSAYLNLFLDAGYVQDYFPVPEISGNDLVNKALYSFGAGIDLVTYYDKMLRLDLARNSLGNWGMYVSLSQDF